MFLLTNPQQHVNTHLHLSYTPAFCALHKGTLAKTVKHRTSAFAQSVINHLGKVIANHFETYLKFNLIQVMIQIASLSNTAHFFVL